MNKVAAIKKLNDTEIELGIAGTGASWHQKYLQCNAMYIGGLSDTFTEQDILALLEQYGTIVHINLVRDSNTNASRGFAFVKYADPRSCILAIDNLNGFEVHGRVLRLDHASDYHDKDGAGLDTTPPELRVRVENASGGAEGQEEAQAGPVELGAEKRRENAVLSRLEQLRKKRRLNSSDDTNTDSTRGPSLAAEPIESFNEQNANIETEHPDRTEKKHKRIEKEKRRREKERRKEERARIRKERAERRAARENAT